jgi:hypothetical protein
MSSISAVKPQAVQPILQPQRLGSDTDGDNDGTTAAAPVAPAPQVSRPTAMLGNFVNTTA